MLSLKLIYLLLFSWPIHSHPVILTFSIFFNLNLSVLHISPPVHNSSPDQATFLYHFPSPNMEMEIVIFVYTIKIIEPYLPLFLCIVFFSHNFQIQQEIGKKIGLSKTKISYKDALRFSQSLTGCCYFKILSSHCEFCCLWQIYRLSKTTIPFKISYDEIVNILVFA